MSLFPFRSTKIRLGEMRFSCQDELFCRVTSVTLLRLQIMRYLNIFSLKNLNL